MKRKWIYLLLALVFVASAAALGIILTNKATSVVASVARNYHLIKVLNFSYSFPIPVEHGTKIKDFLSNDLGINAQAFYNVVNHKKTTLNLEDTITSDASWEVIF